MFEVNNKKKRQNDVNDLCATDSIVDFEQVNVSWDAVFINPLNAKTTKWSDTLKQITIELFECV